MRASVTCNMLIACFGLGVVGFGAGCETIEDNPRSTGTLVGGGAGAGIGSAVAGKGNKTEGALIGAAVGAGAGWLAGDQVDKSNDDDHKRKAERIRRERYDDNYYDRARDADYRDRYDRYDRYDRDFD